MAEIELLLVANERYCAHLATLLMSVAASSDHAVRANVITNDITSSSRVKVQLAAPSIEIRWLECESMAMLPMAMNGVDLISYGRLFAPRQLEGWVDRVIYLDVDTLVRRDLGDLWEFDLKGKGIGAVRDHCVVWIGHPRLGIPDYERFGLIGRSPYFNAGVMVIDIDMWMRTGIDDACHDYITKQTTFRFGDQDVLNAVFHDNWIDLPMEWNVFANLELWPMIEIERSKGEVESARLDPAIVHFASSRKPWSLDRREELLFADEWRSFAEAGPFSRRYRCLALTQRVVTPVANLARAMVPKYR